MEISARQSNILKMALLRQIGYYAEQITGESVAVYGYWRERLKESKDLLDHLNKEERLPGHLSGNFEKKK